MGVCCLLVNVRRYFVYLVASYNKQWQTILCMDALIFIVNECRTSLRMPDKKQTEKRQKDTFHTYMSFLVTNLDTHKIIMM